MIIIITSFFTFAARSLQLKYVILLYIFGNILLFLFLKSILGQLGDWFISFGQLPALLTSATGILIGHSSKSKKNNFNNF